MWQGMPMPVFQDTLFITDKSHSHAVEVTVTHTKGKNVLNVQELAEKAWGSATKEITVDGVTVRVRKLGERGNARP
jgi:hypothetical protein